jgi:hypothetical protein
MTNVRTRSTNGHNAFSSDERTRDAVSWAATGRYGVRPAPDGLALVQDFLNTRASTLTGPDMLCEAAKAEAWGARAVRAWSVGRGTISQLPTLTSHDAAKLRDLRDALDSTLAGVPAANALHLLGTAEFAVAATGEIRWTPTGHGWRWFYCAILGEVLLSQHTGTWRRLKQCRNVACRATFYDSSWNNGAIWHNRNTCAPAFTDPPHRAPAPGRGRTSDHVDS